MCLGASGTGKTWLQERVSELMPEEDKIEITTLSMNAFYYFGKEELKHKLLLIEDMDGAEAVLYPLRELQSKRKISKTVTLKDSKGNLKTVTLNVEGPVCISGCTTREQLYEDNANRCILLYMDNSPEQDKKIMDYQRKLSAGLIDQFEERKVREQIKNVQRILKPVSVRNPYATYLNLPDAVFKPRRTMLLLLMFTETITWYHQYQRELKTDEDTGEQYIESTVADIEAAFILLETTLLKKSDELNDACRTFFESLKILLKQQDTEAFYSKEIRSAMRLSPSSLGRYLYELERMGYIKIIRGNRYKGFEYKIQSWNDLEALTNDAKSMVKTILENIKGVTRNPEVAQGINGLHKVQKISRKKAVTHESEKIAGTLNK
jgi:predicted transcriptional regulator